MGKLISVGRRKPESLQFGYLAITPIVQAQMLAEYIQRPRPLIWRGVCRQAPEEARAAALERCFAGLIEYHEERYERLCDVKLEYAFHRRAGLPVA